MASRFHFNKKDRHAKKDRERSEYDSSLIMGTPMEMPPVEDSTTEKDEADVQRIFADEPIDKTAEVAEEAPADKTAEVAEEAPADKTAEVAEEAPADKTAEVAEEAPADKTAEVAEEALADKNEDTVAFRPEDVVAHDPDPTAATITFGEKKNEEPELVEQQKKDEEAIKSGDISLLFNQPHEEKLPVDEALLTALQGGDVDAKKFDEVFGHKEYAPRSGDNTEALLKEVFGATVTDKKKKKKQKTALTDTAEIRGVFQKENAPQESQDDYVAVHSGEEESTKEYHATFTMAELEGVLSGIEPDAETRAVPKLAEEVNVSESDNPYNDTYEEIEEEKHERRPVLPEEFSSQEEFDEFAEHLRNCNFKALSKLAWTFLGFLALLYLESATFTNWYHPEFLQPDGVYNVIYLLVDLQLILLSSLFVLPLLADGAKGLFTGKPNRASIPFVATLFALVHTVYLLVTDGTDYPLFGVNAALFHFGLALAELLEAKRVHRTFRICGKPREKLVACPVVGESAEAEAFRDQLQGEPLFFSAHKAKFVDGFFRRVSLPSKSESAFGWTVLLCLILSAAMATLSYLKEPNMALAINRFMMMGMMTLPFSSVFAVVLPFSHLSKKAAKKDAAIIGAADAETCAAADVVSFADKEIFPPKSVKVTTIRTYGQTRIDKAILYAAMIFQKLGGPLSLVFKKTISGVYSEIPEDFDFLEITADGMCAKIEGKDVFVGSKDYLLAYDFGYTKDSVDENFEAHSGKIMYMVIGSELAAKFYIRYSISRRFKKTILSLFKCGICPAVKTCDPNIDSDLFRTLLQNDKIPAGIIKTCEAMKDAPALERCESGVVCNSTIANLLSTFSLCESLRHLIRSNVFIKVLSALIGAGIVLFLYFVGGTDKITGLFILIYQLLWMLPVMIPSLSE